MWQFQVNSVTEPDSKKEKFEKPKSLNALQKIDGKYRGNFIIIGNYEHS